MSEKQSVVGDHLKTIDERVTALKTRVENLAQAQNRVHEKKDKKKNHQAHHTMARNLS